MEGRAASTRHRWVDHARGICILLIVMLHARYALAAVEDVLIFDAIIEFVRPFRLPALFFVSGLFLARMIDKPWPEFLDKRVLHYAYFYALWASIEFAPLAAGSLARGEPAGELAADYGQLFIAPHGPLWFIYALPFFFVLAKLLRRVPAWVVLPMAALVSMAELQTGWVIGDRILSRYFYFHAGYVFAPLIFAAGRIVIERPWPVWTALAIWASLHFVLVAVLPINSDSAGAFVLGVAGTLAVMAAGALLSRLRAADWIAYLGSRSLIVYLAFPLLLVVMRKLIELAGVPLAGDLQMLIVIGGSIIGALLIHAVASRTPLRFLFERPAWAGLRTRVPAPRATTAGVKVKAPT